MFSTTGAFEGYNYITTGKLVSLSDQNIIDCACERFVASCSLIEVSAGLSKMGGIESEDSYPDDPFSHECRLDPAKIALRYTGFVDIPSNENLLQSAVANIGPISVAIDASYASFQLYKSGGMYFHWVFNAYYRQNRLI